jgi:hypothetical protein
MIKLTLQEIKKLDPTIFERAMNYIALNTNHENVCIEKGCCRAIRNVFSEEGFGFYEADEMKELYAKFLARTLASTRRDCDTYWWEGRYSANYDIFPENQTARIIALQLGAIRLREIHTEIKLKEEKQVKCNHNVMVRTNDKNFAWRCANCGYVYGKGIK